MWPGRCRNDGKQAQNFGQCVIQELELEIKDVVRSAGLHDGACNHCGSRRSQSCDWLVWFIAFRRKAATHMISSGFDNRLPFAT